MGDRAHLEVFLSENELSKDEAEYYRDYVNWDGSKEGHEALAIKAHNISHVWNDNFRYSPNQVPRCDYVLREETYYFSPDESFSREEDLHFEVKNFIPESWLRLFKPTDFKGQREYRGHIFSCSRFLSTASEVLKLSLIHI